jgi:hypothetical protein
MEYQTLLYVNTQIFYSTTMTFAACKTYYVDGHEREDVIDDRISYIIRYIKETIRSYEWVQVAREQMQPLFDDEDNDSRVDIFVRRTNTQKRTTSKCQYSQETTTNIYQWRE